MLVCWRLRLALELGDAAPAAATAAQRKSGQAVAAGNAQVPGRNQSAFLLGIPSVEQTGLSRPTREIPAGPCTKRRGAAGPMPLQVPDCRGVANRPSPTPATRDR